MPIPRLRSTSRVLKGGAVLTALVYVALLTFPRIAFAHSLDHGDFRVYTTEPVTGADSTALVALLDRVDRRLATSEIYARKGIHRLYLAPSHRWFAFFAPGSRRAFAINRRLTHDILVNAADVSTNAVRNGSAQNGERALDAVLAHEVTHTFLARTFGKLRLVQADAAGEGLRQEGYCDYVAGETSFDTERGLAMLRRGERERSASFAYFRWATAVQHLVEVEGASVERVVFGDWDVDAVLARAVPPSNDSPER